MNTHKRTLVAASCVFFLVFTAAVPAEKTPIDWQKHARKLSALLKSNDYVRADNELAWVTSYFKLAHQQKLREIFPAELGGLKLATSAASLMNSRRASYNPSGSASDKPVVEVEIRPFRKSQALECRPPKSLQSQAPAAASTAASAPAPAAAAGDAGAFTVGERPGLIGKRGTPEVRRAVVCAVGSSVTFSEMGSGFKELKKMAESFPYEALEKYAAPFEKRQPESGKPGAEAGLSDLLAKLDADKSYADALVELRAFSEQVLSGFQEKLEAFFPAALTNFKVAKGYKGFVTGQKLYNHEETGASVMVRVREAASAGMDVQCGPGKFGDPALREFFLLGDRVASRPAEALTGPQMNPLLSVCPKGAVIEFMLLEPAKVSAEQRERVEKALVDEMSPEKFKYEQFERLTSASSSLEKVSVDKETVKGKEKEKVKGKGR